MWRMINLLFLIFISMHFQTTTSIILEEAKKNKTKWIKYTETVMANHYIALLVVLYYCSMISMIVFSVNFAYTHYANVRRRRRYRLYTATTVEHDLKVHHKAHQLRSKDRKLTPELKRK